MAGSLDICNVDKTGHKTNLTIEVGKFHQSLISSNLPNSEV